MSQNDSAVVTAAVGYVYVAAPGTPRPTPAALAALDPEAFGAQSYTVSSSVAAPFTLAVGEAVVPSPDPVVAPETADIDVPTSKTAKTSTTTKAVAADEGKAIETTAELPAESGAAEVQAALEALPSVGAGNVKVTGETISAPGFTVAFIGKLQGQEVVLTATGATATVASTPNGWSTVGHTARDDLPEFGFDGGDTEVRGTWQNENLREVVTKPISDFLTIFLQQWDMNSLTLYYGQDAAKQSGVFGVKGGTPTPVERALFIVIVDGDTKIGFYAPKASIKRDDSISLATDEFASLPVRATFLKFGSSNVFEWVNEELFTP
jgi:hypothetical protein